jgi:L-histidine N-alpha-methyltransferase
MTRLAAKALDQTMASPSIADDVRRGLTRTPKAVPPYLFYDDAGSRLYERITELPEYYLTSAEHSILEMYADAIVRLASDGCARPTTLVELGAGSAHKTMLPPRSSRSKMRSSPLFT